MFPMMMKEPINELLSSALVGRPVVNLHDCVQNWHQDGRMCLEQFGEFSYLLPCWHRLFLVVEGGRPRRGLHAPPGA